MKCVRFFAILALALTLAGCKKESSDSQKLFGTSWESNLNTITETRTEKTRYTFTFDKGEKCTLRRIWEMRTKMSDPDESTDCHLSGTFSLKGNTIKIVLDKVADGDYSGDLPMYCNGTMSDDELMLMIDVEGHTLAFMKWEPLSL
ncbi:MAG: hypothetical protein IK045_01805 [Bacteroidales bacterium]|nr:hypothetical protein [Bacteroidales bacterium]